MEFGNNLATARKSKKLSQDELAKKVGTIAVTIGRYERGEIRPSIEVASKIADELEVSLDWLVGSTDTVLDKKLAAKIANIQNLPPEDLDCVHRMLDAFLRDHKAKKAYAS